MRRRASRNVSTTPGRLAIFVATWAIVSCGAPAAERPVAVPIQGESFAAELVACDATWRLVFDPARRLPAGELVRWGICREVSRGSMAVLADGSVLAGELLGVDRGTIRFDAAAFGPVSLPAAAMAGVVFDLPFEQDARDRLLDRLLGAEDRSDVVLLANGDQLAGSLAEFHDGVIQLETGAGPLEIAAHQATAIVFQPALREPARREGLRAWVGLADGSCVLGASLVIEGRAARIVPAALAGADVSWQVAPEEIVFLQPLGGRAEYLSDREADRTRQIPFLDVPWPSRRDRNVLGGRLRVGGRLFPKGLGVHSYSCLTYALAEPYEAFQAELALDDAAGEGGSVRWRVYVDRQKRFESDVVRGQEAPVPVRIDLRGAKRLDLIVDFADRTDQLDRADWLDARLIRGAPAGGAATASE